jgi:hypothetical protein
MMAMRGIAAPVLMISVDGLKPEYVFEAEERGLKLPYLRSLLRSGTYARGVTGVWPTDGDLSQPYDAGDRRVAGGTGHFIQRRV